MISLSLYLSIDKGKQPYIYNSIVNSKIYIIRSISQHGGAMKDYRIVCLIIVA